MKHNFHIDHFFPQSHFTPAQLKSKGFSEDESSDLREKMNCLPNLQLLGGVENQEKHSMLPVEWLATFKPDVRAELVNVHMLGDVPNDLSQFHDFYLARRKKLKSEIKNLLT